MSSGSKNDSRIKKSKTKQKMVFAKDKNQVILMFVVLTIFFANSIYMIVKYVQEQSPPPPSANQNTSASTENPGTPPRDPEPLAQNPNAPVTEAQNPNMAEDANNIYSQTLDLQKNNPDSNLKTAQTSEEDVEIMSKNNIKKKSGKTVLITIANSGRENPFLPSNESLVKIVLNNKKLTPINVPKKPISYPYLLPPPKALPQNTDASKIINTTISGILYDKYSPSAIINIDGSDYLVKQGDVVNQYKILLIDKTKVVVQLRSNIYQAGVGELLSQTDLNYNAVANLNRKFGGNDISINVRKKGY